MGPGGMEWDFPTNGWVEGEPAFWTNSEKTVRAVLQVKTFRCTGCGYLESYATAE